MNYIGLDAHSKTCTFVVLDRRGRQVQVQRVKTGEKEILGFVRSLKGKKHLTYEEANLSKWLYPLLKSEVDELVVCNAAYMNRRSGAKDDYPDALHLAQQLRGGFLTPVYHEDNFFSELRNVVSEYLDMDRELTRLKNRYKALFRSEAHETEGKAIYSDRTRIAELKREADRFVAEGLFQQIELLTALKEEYLIRFKEHERTYPQIRALATIPGIAATRACIIAAIVCSPSRFENKFKFWSYSQLVKRDQQSDGVSYGKKQTPGNLILKNVFLGAAETILQKNKGGLRQYYDRMRSQEVDHRAAKKNLARKVAAISLAVMRTKQNYKEDYELETNKTIATKV